jgi:hypothetical protein
MQVESLKYTLLDKLISINDQAVLAKINEFIGSVDLNDTRYCK